ncbi:relaxase/mobilization nuclease domain-containing protein [Stackebrandtia nassauensis]|uniref:MobA/VirD2-like nuclease domain-containing protein n=1 Tax=Stackebrandtia nassauensis (strain DSM 44728 / CIP 108903 / NRRL B-16338 / NBRC 102104 / LLR-40K-21) TaxID=446470 RepID=D3Q369_STANL|nr:relaxase/mobilization nuclease domain-containing protein [Stackebrandtia nassauensis]ADD40039.1 hypothetical protein Snas_0321 [Stackebrandtia nassauensis DSM 44728]
MIGKVAKRSRRVRGLLHYLFGPGDANEHTDPRVVAGYAPAASLQPSGNLASGFDVAGLARRLEAAERSLPEGRGPVRNVWHCALSLPPGERLNHETWGRLAERFADEMGLTETPDRPGCRWVAVHHGDSAGGNDHIHVVAILVCDGDPPRPEWLRRDYPRVQRACARLEAEFGLIQATPGRESGRGRPAASRAEYRRAARTGKPLDRDVLRREVRAAAAGANTELEFAARLHAAGLRVRTRSNSEGLVVGYAVALPPAESGQPRWLSGSKLEADLGLPQLRSRWPESAPAAAAAWEAPPPIPAVGRVTDPDQAWRQLPEVLEQVTGSLRDEPLLDAELGGTARTAADLTALLAARAEPGPRFGPVSRAADQLGRAAAGLPCNRRAAAVGLLHEIARAIHRSRIGQHSDSVVLHVAIAVVHLAAAIQALCAARANASGTTDLALNRLRATVGGLHQAARDATPNTPQARSGIASAFARSTNVALGKHGPGADAGRAYRPRPTGPKPTQAEL